MSEQLNFQLGLDATPMIQGAAAATQQVKTKFDALHSQIKSTMAQPIQMEIQLKGDKASQQYQQLATQIKNAKEAQHKLNLEGIKAGKSAELQRQFGNSVKVSAQQLQKAKGKLEQLLLSKKKNSEAAKRLQAEIDKINLRLTQMKPPSGIGGFFKGLVGKMTLAGTAANLLTQAINKIGQGAVGLVQTGAQVEVLKLQLEAFTGSTGKADAVFRQFVDIAAKTPFDLMQVAQAGKTMMAFGVETDKAVRITEQLGVVAAGSGGNLNEMARNMGQIAAQGQAYTRDLTQFAMQGIPIWEEMSRVTGASVSQLKKMAADGKISFDIVEQALSNMTAKGTAFQQVGERIGDTWIGKFAQIAAGIQQFAGSLLEAFTNLDQVLGGSLKNGLQGIADGFKSAAENANELVSAILGIAAAIAVMAIGTFVQMVMNGFIPALRMIIKVKKSWLTIIKALVVAKQYLKAMMGPVGWASIAIGIGVAVGATKMFTAELDKAGEASKRLRDEQSEAMSQTQDTSTALGMTYEAAMEKYKGATDSAITELKKLEAEKANLLRKQVEIQDQYAALKTSAVEAFDAITVKFKEQQVALNDQIVALERRKKALDVLGPAQRELKALAEKELRYTAETGRQLEGHITSRDRAKLQAQAQLEQMENQKRQAEKQKEIDEKREKLQNLQLQYAKDKAAHDEKMAGYAAAQATEMSRVATALEAAAVSIQTLVDKITNGMAPGLDNAKSDANELAPAISKSKKPLNDTATSAGNLSSNLGSAATNAWDLAEAISSIPPVPSGPPNAFSGGPVSGGDMRTVNELGKEAFLSASGKLSMINAPAWGEWRAPGAGTIIPAHLTKQLDIPTGGININKAPGAGAGVGAAVKVIQASGGDVFHQNVTVQSANPTQTANNMMVEMTRLRRRRFG